MTTAQRDRPRMPPVVLQGRRIIFRNFSGEAGKFNEKGKRNFNLVLEPEEAARMAADGWNVRQLKPKDDTQDEPLWVLKININFGGRVPPNVVLITNEGRSKTTLDEDMVSVLDTADIENLDLSFNPYYYETDNNELGYGYSAWLKSLYVTIRQDELDLKYADVPEA